MFNFFEINHYETKTFGHFSYFKCFELSCYITITTIEWTFAIQIILIISSYKNRFQSWQFMSVNTELKAPNRRNPLETIK